MNLLSTNSHPLSQPCRVYCSHGHRQVVPWYHTLSGD